MMNIKKQTWVGLVLVLVLTFSLMTGCGKDSSTSSSEKPKESLSNSEAFTVSLHDVLLEVSSQSQDMGALQLDMLFNPAADVDTNRSNSTNMKISMQNPDEPEEMMVITSESLHNAKSGDASFTIGMGQGEEQLNSGGVYFVGDNMLLKRGNTEKKMVSHTLNPEQAASYKNVSPVERLGLVLDGDISAATSWSAAVDSYIAKVVENTEEADFDKGEKDVTVLKEQQNCQAVRLSLTGEKAQLLLLGMIDLLQQEPALDGLFEELSASGSDGSEINGLAVVQNSLTSLTAEEIAALDLSIITLDFNHQSLGFELQAKTGDRILVMKQLFYSENYERHNEIGLKTFASGDVTFSDINVSAGGDKYQGEIAFLVSKADGSMISSFKCDSNSVKSDNNYQAEYTFTSNSADSDDEDIIEVSNSGGHLTWEQKKNKNGDISGSGNGETTISVGDENNIITFDISLEQKYTDVTITPPQFVESAGLKSSNREELLTSLEMSENDFDNQSVLSRKFGGIATIIY